MNVRELRQQLEGVPDDFPVLFSTDQEGNSFCTVAEVEVSYYRVESPHSFEFEVVHPDDVDEDDEDQALVLWP